MLTPKGPDVLTPVQKQILMLVAMGLTNRQIAVQLQIKEKTVSNQLYLIFQKLGVSNRTQAAIQAREQGLIRPDSKKYNSS